MSETSCDIGLIGLAVMGQNLVLNMNDHGFKVAVFNRTVSKVDDFIADEAKGTNVVGAHTIEELAGLLKRPRRIMLMVKAGDTVDQMIEHVCPTLRRETSSSTAVTRSLLIPTAAQNIWPIKEFSSSAPASPAAKKARASVPPSCPAVTRTHGRT